MTDRDKTEHRPHNNAVSAWSLDSLSNVGFSVTETARRMPGAIAVAAPNGKNRSGRINYDTITFAELDARSNQIALGLHQLGVKPGTRFALMVPPGIEFVSFVMGMFKAGIVVILIDPGMGRKNMIQCLSEALPQGIVGIAKAQIARRVFKRKFPLCKTNVIVGKNYWPGCHVANKFFQLNGDDFSPPSSEREDQAAIIFTTGSTGPPKGVLYRHRTFIEQARQIRDYFEIQPGSVDVSGFPLFALFNSAMGTTTVFPKMDATRPANVDPLNIKDAIERFQADQSFGSPALWNTVSLYCEKHRITFPTIRRILSAGAPVPPHVLKRIKSIIHPDGDAFTPYGATESLPVACSSATVVLGETAKKTAQGHGTCVGARFPDIQWRVIEITDRPILEFSETKILSEETIGELIVCGDVVTDQYVTQTNANAMHKISDGKRIWHRMGDVGYLDDQQRFWFCGRKSHRVTTAEGTMFTIPVEGIINSHPSVYRSALVGVGQPNQQIPVLVIEPWPDDWPKSSVAQDSLAHEIKKLASENEKTKVIKHVLLRKHLPVDIRHNSKIFREKLSVWAAPLIKDDY